MNTPAIMRWFVDASTYATNLLLVAGGPGAALLLFAAVQTRKIFRRAAAGS